MQFPPTLHAVLFSLSMQLTRGWRCRFFPSVYYLSTSKVAIAVLGNMAFALALTLYNLTTKVCCHSAYELSSTTCKVNPDVM